MEWDASDDWLPGEYVFGDYCYIPEECMEDGKNLLKIRIIGFLIVDEFTILLVNIF